MDVAAFVMWGYVAYNKDQELLFRFEDRKLVSYDAVVLPDPTPQATGHPSLRPNTIKLGAVVRTAHPLSLWRLGLQSV